MISTICISCGNKNSNEISLESIKSGFTLITCDKCKTIYFLDITNKVDFYLSNIINKECTDIDILTPVLITNKAHREYCKEGVIIDKDDLTYKIKLYDDRIIWVLYDWVIEGPILDDCQFPF